VHSLSTLGARTSHGQLRIHKTPHGPNLGEATTFPLIIYYVLLHEAHIQMTICPGTPKWEPQNSCTWRNRGDFQLLVVGSQIANLTSDPSFAIICVSGVQMGHVSPFQTSKFQEISNGIRNVSIQWVLTPAITLLNIRESIGTLTLKMWVHLGVWGFIPSHSFALLGAWDVTLALFLLGPQHCKPLPWLWA
jgi:hypothetical protein